MNDLKKYVIYYLQKSINIGTAKPQAYCNANICHPELNVCAHMLYVYIQLCMQDKLTEEAN